MIITSNGRDLFTCYLNKTNGKNKEESLLKSIKIVFFQKININ